MDMLSEIYSKSADVNEKNLSFWEDYLQSLKNIDFSIYSDKLKVPVLVPIGSRISFRGELKHTNEVTVALGADYFVKCSVKQAEVLLQRRIKDAQSNIEIVKKEKQYLESQISFTQTAFNDHGGQEIIEHYSEEEDKAWRKAHRENVKRYKQSKSQEDEGLRGEITDEELWDRLEELELREELANELANVKDENIDNQQITKNKASFSFEKEHIINNLETKSKIEEINEEKTDTEQEKRVTFKETKTAEQTSNSDKLQHVIDKQIELEKLIYEVRNKARVQNKSTEDLLATLDELEQLDELEDELDRLSDMIDDEDLDEEEEEDDDDDEDTSGAQAPKLQRRVSFVDEDDSNTLEITFTHSPVDSNHQPYNPAEGIQTPGHIYDAHSKLFENGTTSILKKSKYETVAEKSDIKKEDIPRKKVVQFDNEDVGEPETIVIKDVVEKVTQADPKVLSQARPTSLFKKKRMQSKS
ncbi:hypothetical protein PYW07_006873 [Mythimna separata]|uniref:Unconventional prefoldin RPB5 interactor n=1 Tax=Mythimna separata TaxID=271217 RepID=A0AAD8E0P4_MYTSE|nr:hypothetical protein PYW07_006873 [Mythimna separata]